MKVFYLASICAESHAIGLQEVFSLTVHALVTAIISKQRVVTRHRGHCASCSSEERKTEGWGGLLYFCPRGLAGCVTWSLHNCEPCGMRTLSLSVCHILPFFPPSLQLTTFPPCVSPPPRCPFRSLTRPSSLFFSSVCLPHPLSLTFFLSSPAAVL